MEEQVRAPVEDRRDLAGLYSRIKTHIPLVALSTIAMMVAAGVATQFIPKKYSASAVLNYAPKEVPLKTSSNVIPLSDEARDAQIEAQIQTMQSLDVARAVVASQKLDKDPEFIKAAKKFARQSPVNSDALAAAALENLNVRRSGQSPLITINYTSRDPLQAATLASSFAREYYALQTDRQVKQSRQVSESLDKKVDALRKQVETADAAVAKFRLEHNLLSTPGSMSPEQEIASIQADLAMARANAAEAASRGAASRYAIPGGGANGPINTNTISQLQQQKAEVERRVASLSARYGPRHPQLIDANKELSAIDSQIGQEMSRIKATAGAEASAVGSRAASLSASLNAARARMADNVSASVRLGDLQREADNLRQIYQNLLQSSSEESARRSLIRPDVMITSLANVPLRPSSPNLLLNLLGGLVAGFALGVSIAYVRERWSQGLNTVDDIATLLGQNHLNSIPTLKSSIDKPKTKDPVEAVSAHPLSAYTEAFRNLATSLTYAAAAKKGKVLGISSALPKEGKTTTSIALAHVLASAGQNVLLVDADLRRRSVTTTLNPDASKGLVQVVRGECRLGEALLREETSGFDVLPLAPESHLGPMPFEAASFNELIVHLRGRYDAILFDTAPVLAVADTRILLHHFDAMVLLARWKATPVKAVRAALHQIESVGGAVTGIALTMVDLRRQAESGYGDASYYYGYMKDYYAAA